MTGLVSSAYTAGNITITGAATAVGIWNTIISQLDANADAGPVQVTLLADPANTSDVLIGAPGVSPSSYGYNLSPGVSKTYVASTRQGIVPLARMFMYSDSNATLHVECYP